jgi:hypothetical protein
MRVKTLFAVANFAFFGVIGVPAHAGLINPTSTVDIFFNFTDPTSGPISAPSQVFDTAARGPFSLAAPIIPPTTPIHTTEPYNLSAITGFWFTDNQITIYNNDNTGAAFDSTMSFDFKFTNENITSVNVNSASASDFLPLSSLILVSPNEFTLQVEPGTAPLFLSTLVLDVTTGGVSPVPGPTVGAGLPGAILAFGGLMGWMRRRKAALAA